MGATPADLASKKAIAAVRRTLDAGRKRYVLTRGVLSAGIPLFFLMSVLPSLGLVPWLEESLDNPVFNILTGAVLWPLAGYLLGLVLWRRLEWRYDALSRRQ